MNFQFVSWSLRGAAALPPQPGQAPGAHRVVTQSLKLVATRNGEAPSTRDVTSAPINLLGPGDVVGIDPDQIVRRTPRPGDHQMEPNYLATIEFAHPDLPWLFSAGDVPGMPSRTVMPWLMLVVVADRGPGTLTAGGAEPNPLLTVDAAELPDPASAWAWAHVQVHKDIPNPADALATVGSDWAGVRSRLVAPTRLRPNSAYLACVVPVFEAGRLAGRGLAVPPDVAPVPWQAAGEVALPVFDHWRFGTGPAGDFHTLARRLHPVADPGRLGERRVAVEPVASRLHLDGDPDLGFPPATRSVPTAIAKAGTVPAPPGGPATPGAAGLAPETVQNPPDPQIGIWPRLKELLDLTAKGADAPEPIVGPPLYGQWHAAVTTLDGSPGIVDLVPPPADSAQGWVAGLNADPEMRVAAGLAARVVQRDQETLMADAFRQLQDLMLANRRVRWSQVFATAAGHLHGQVAQLKDDRALRFANPSLARLRSPGETVTISARIAQTNIPPVVVGPAFARVARFASRAAANAQPATGAVQLLVDAFRAQSAAVVPARLRQQRRIDPGAVGAVLGAAGLAERVTAVTQVPVADYVARLENAGSLVSTTAAEVTASLQQQAAVPLQPAVVPSDIAVALQGPDPVALRLAPSVAFARDAIETGQHLVTPSVANELRAFSVPEPSFVSLDAVRAVNDGILASPQLVRPPVIDLHNETVVLSREALSRSVPSFQATGITQSGAASISEASGLQSVVLAKLNIDHPLVPQPIAALAVDDQQRVAGLARALGPALIAPDTARQFPPLTVLDPATSSHVVDGLAPRAAYERMLTWAHELVGPAVRRRTPIHPVMAAPAFPAPAVERLRAFDGEWVLGGAGGMEPNSICILEVNRRFVEAFLVGANHEMARELVWRGYPTDSRGSCFRRFWPTVAQPGGPVPDDIAPIDQWGNRLGNNPATGAVEAYPIIVIKGDLLRRYPSTIVTAELGKANHAGDHATFTNKAGSAPVPEIFRGSLDPDISYVALNMVIDTLLANADNDGNAWYISLRQPFDEPHFGLEEIDPPLPPGTPPPPQGPNPDDWTWQQIPGGEPRHLRPDDVATANASAHAAFGLFRSPFRLLLRATDYAPVRAGG